MKRIIDHLPDELKNNVDYVEEDAAYTILMLRLIFGWMDLLMMIDLLS
ncbi:hypothetical protein [uncultured Methanobrevibacter sp.]|nr:hypothetical protein [uncultured Methanobrevibacter sp.]